MKLALDLILIGFAAYGAYELFATRVPQVVSAAKAWYNAPSLSDRIAALEKALATPAVHTTSTPAATGATGATGAS